MQPSNLQITALNLEGNRRFEKTKSSSSETSKKEKSDDKNKETKVEKKK
jgi:hypothetical protein